MHMPQFLALLTKSVRQEANALNLHGLCRTQIAMNGEQHETAD